MCWAPWGDALKSHAVHWFFVLQVFKHLCHSVLLVTFFMTLSLLYMFHDDIFYKHPDVTADMAQTKIGQTSRNKSLLFSTAITMHLYASTERLNLEAGTWTT